jgi:hypothetical protein
LILLKKEVAGKLVMGKQPTFGELTGYLSSMVSKSLPLNKI